MVKRSAGPSPLPPWSMVRDGRAPNPRWVGVGSVFPLWCGCGV